jgi:uracil-DNA glycosylase
MGGEDLGVNRERRIRNLKRLEKRVARCNRCRELRDSCRRPSYGVGSVEPDIVVVFAAANIFNQDRGNLRQLAEILHPVLDVEAQAYYTFLVRCRPRLCPVKEERDRWFKGCCIDENGLCILSSQPCNGSPREPSIHEILNCLYFTVEEIAALEPLWVVTVGNSVARAVLHAFGIFTYHIKEQDLFVRVFESSEYRFICLPDFDDIEQCRKIMTGFEL